MRLPALSAHKPNKRKRGSDAALRLTRYRHTDGLHMTAHPALEAWLDQVYTPGLH